MPSRPPGNLYLLTRPAMFLLHVPAVLAVVVAVLLGNWQLDSWQLHREDRAAELADVEPVPLEDVLGADDPFPGDAVGRPVSMTGRWLPDDAVHVADRPHEGETGFWTVVPLSTCGSAGQGSAPQDCAQPAAMPVVVGWSPTVEEAPAPPTGAAHVVGWLQPGEAAAGQDEDPSDRVLRSLRIADLLQRVDQDLYGAYVILESPAEARDGLAAVTPDSLPEPPTSAGLRNLLYGLEWWLFAGFAVFLWWRWTKDELAAARARATGVTVLSTDADVEPEAAPARIPSEP
jgi:surfeit locus 1 family protein